jgi:hypothetical protein
VAVGIVWQSLWDAIWPAVGLWFLGGVAISVISGICDEMTPSMPPGLEAHSGVSGWVGHWWNVSSSAVHQHAFAVLFAVLVGVKSGVQLAHFSSVPSLRLMAARALRAMHRLRHDWFSLLIKNAFGAFVSVLLIQMLQQFSWSHILWGMVMDLLHPVFDWLGHLFGGVGLGILGRWWDWFGDNQTKFLFWLLYSAGICDDLGLPNYKTLARWGWRRARRYFRERAGAELTA